MSTKSNEKKNELKKLIQELQTLKDEKTEFSYKLARSKQKHYDLKEEFEETNFKYVELLKSHNLLLDQTKVLLLNNEAMKKDINRMNSEKEKDIKRKAESQKKKAEKNRKEHKYVSDDEEFNQKFFGRSTKYMEGIINVPEHPFRDDTPYNQNPVEKYSSLSNLNDTNLRNNIMINEENENIYMRVLKETKMMQHGKERVKLFLDNLRIQVPEPIRFKIGSAHNILWVYRVKFYFNGVKLICEGRAPDAKTALELMWRDLSTKFC